MSCTESNSVKNAGLISGVFYGEKFFISSWLFMPDCQCLYLADIGL